MLTGSLGDLSWPEYLGWEGLCVIQESILILVMTLH